MMAILLALVAAATPPAQKTPKKGAAPNKGAASKTPAASAAPKGKKALPRGPLTFRASSMTLEPREHRTLLEGAVHLERDDLTVTGDRAVAEFAEADPQTVPAKAVSPAGDKQQLRKFTVDGSVHLEKPGPVAARTADGDHAVLDVPAQTLVLLGAPPAQAGGGAGPVLREGKEVLTGERILLHLETDQLEDVVRPLLRWRKLGAQHGEHLAPLHRPVELDRDSTSTDAPPQDNLELEDGTLVPLVEDAVIKVDLEQGRIHLNPGFTD